MAEQKQPSIQQEAQAVLRTKSVVELAPGVTRDLSSPSAKVYLDLILIAVDLYVRGQDTSKLGEAAQALMAGGDNAALALSVIAALSQGDIEKLTAILLQYPTIDEGLAEIAKYGWSLELFLDLLAANLEQLDLERLQKNWSRFMQAAQKRKKTQTA